MATAYARLAGPTHIPADLAAAAEVVTTAMRRYPHMTGGTGRLGTSLMAGDRRGRIIAKSGAEGVFCVGWPACGLGLAMKIDDGARPGGGAPGHRDSLPDGRADGGRKSVPWPICAGPKCAASPAGRSVPWKWRYRNRWRKTSCICGQVEQSTEGNT